eukprot:3933828-Rhodomonas_salina.2
MDCGGGVPSRSLCGPAARTWGQVQPPAVPHVTIMAIGEDNSAAAVNLECRGIEGFRAVGADRRVTFEVFETEVDPRVAPA